MCFMYMYSGNHPLQIYVLVHRRTIDHFSPPSLPYIYLSYYCPIFPTLPSLNSRMSRILSYVETRSLLNGKTDFFLINMINPPSDSSSGDIFYCRHNPVYIIVS